MSCRRSIGPPPPATDPKDHIKWPLFLGPNVKSRGRDQRPEEERFSSNAKRPIMPPTVWTEPFGRTGRDGLEADFESPSRPTGSANVHASRGRELEVRHTNRSQSDAYPRLQGSVQSRPQQAQTAPQ